MIVGVACKHVGKSRLHTDPHQRQAPGRFPLLGLGELLLAEGDTDLLVGPVGMGSREAHGGVQVVRATVKRAFEDAHDETRIHQIEHVSDAVFDTCTCHFDGVRGVELDADHPGVRDARCQGISTLGVIVGDDPKVEECPPSGNSSGRRPHAPCSDHQNPHGSS